MHDARRAAREALGRYGIEGARLRLLSRSEATSYRVDAAGERFLLRVQPAADGRTAAQVASEAAWTGALARDTDLIVPTPVPTRDGEPVARVRGRVCNLQRWVPGRAWRREARPSHLERLGRAMAALHAHGARWTPPPGFERPAWTADTIFGERGFLGAGDRNVWDLLPPGRAERLRPHAAWARGVLDGLDARGLIHADLHFHNVVFAKGEARPIDFDDCGTGPWAYDFAASLERLRFRADWPAPLTPFLRGYERERPAPRAHLDALDPAIAGRIVGLCLWVCMVAERRPALRPKIAGWLDAFEGDLARLPLP